eukprot:gene15461-biopygen6678
MCTVRCMLGHWAPGNVLLDTSQPPHLPGLCKARAAPPPTCPLQREEEGGTLHALALRLSGAAGLPPVATMDNGNAGRQQNSTRCRIHSPQTCRQFS